MLATEELIEAVKRGDASTVARILTSEPASAAAHDGESPILTAVYHGQASIVEALLAANPPLTLFEAAAVGNAAELRRQLENSPEAVNSFSNDGWTPLHLASFFNRSDAAQALLAVGADPNVVSRNGMAVTPLQSALANSASAIALMLIERGANVDGGSWTPLHYAAANNLPEVAGILLQRGVDVNALNTDGATPLTLAQTEGHTELAALLLEHGAHVT